MSPDLSARVRLRGSSALGTVVSVPYAFRGELRVGVIWDAAPKWWAAVSVSSLVSVLGTSFGVPPEARPYSVGAMGGGRR